MSIVNKHGIQSKIDPLIWSENTGKVVYIKFTEK